MEIRYYETSSGRIPVKDFIACLSDDVQKEYIDAIKILRKGGIASDSGE